MWWDLNSTRAHIKYAEAFLTNIQCDTAMALNHMDVNNDKIYDAAFPTDE